VRLLFLDFDGVLHSTRANLDNSYFCWLPILERLLSDFPDVMLVVHSTWRYEYTDDELRKFLGSLGDRFIGSAPRGPREQAIEMVLQANKGKVTDHLVLDDAPEEFPEGRLNTLFLHGLRGIGSAMDYAPLAVWLISPAVGKGDGDER
jgi:hypothetical protein